MRSQAGAEPPTGVDYDPDPMPETRNTATLWSPGPDKNPAQFRSRANSPAGRPGFSAHWEQRHDQNT